MYSKILGYVSYKQIILIYYLVYYMVRLLLVRIVMGFLRAGTPITIPMDIQSGIGFLQTP